jgi:signal transduction histidine kinase/DNA-binding response OmpR family regulator
MIGNVITRLKKNKFCILLIIFISFSVSGFSQNMDSLQAVWQNTMQPDSNRMKSLKEISWYTTINGDADSGFLLAQTLLDFADQHQNPKIKAAALKTMGLASYFNKNYEKALDYYNQGLKQAEMANARVEMSNIYNNIGVTNNAMGNYTTALDAHQKSLDIKKELGLKKGMAYSYNNMGIIYNIQENLPKALDYFQKNLTLCEELNMPRRKAQAYQNIAAIYLKQEKFNQALDYLRNSEESMIALGYKRELPTIYNNMGIALKGLGELDEAQNYYQKALTIDAESNDKPTDGDVLRNLGNVYSLKHDFKNAMECYQKNLAIKTKIGDKNQIVAATVDIGFLYLTQNQPKLAEKWCQKAYKQANEFNYLLEIVNSCKCLKDTYKRLGNIQMAYRFQEEYYSKRDSMDKLENAGEVARLAMKYDFEKQFLADSLSMVEAALKTKLTYQENLTKEKNRKNTVMFAGFAVLLLSAGLFSWLIMVRRNNRRLEEKNIIIEREKNRAEDSERSKEQFFSNVSHEFRTPLTLILGPLDSLLSKTNNREFKQELSIMQRNANRLYSMINELLNLYKLESGKISLKATHINITEFINTHIQSFEPLGKQKDIKLSFSSNSKDCYVYVDVEKLEKIMSNLLSNAFKFTKKGGKIKVSVNCRNSDEHHDVKVSVADTGIGIPDDKLTSIFDRFYQVGDSDKRGYPGTGIGLALTKELVELHHGRIWVESELGEGSKFTFTLPMGKNHLNPGEIYDEKEEDNKLPVIDDQETLSESEENEETVSTETMPILLIVEDNTDMRKYIRSCFNKNLYKIIEANNGEEGFDKAVEKIPDLIISDIMMPEMDGNEMCAKIKTDERTSHIPVVLVTARTSVEQKIQGIETGADAYISKPFHAKELEVWVKKLIEQRKKLRQSFMRTFNTGLQLSHENITGVDQQFVQKALKVVDSYISDPEFSVELFGREMAMSRVQLHRKLKAITDQSASQFIRTIRLKKAADDLISKDTNIKETAYKFGFNNVSYFNKCFHAEYGMTPSEFIRKHNA